MKPSRFSEEQIIGMLKEQDAGSKTADICRKYGISAATFYKFKGKYGNPAMPNDVNSFLYFKDQVTPWINAEK